MNRPDACSSTVEVEAIRLTQLYEQSGFYIAIAAIPATFAIYKFSAQGTDQKPYFTRLIESYNSWQETYRARNDLHTQMVEQAAADKNLFLNERGTKHVDLRFPE